jgi:Fe-S cluster assembly protein SufD
MSETVSEAVLEQKKTAAPVAAPAVPAPAGTILAAPDFAAANELPAWWRDGRREAWSLFETTPAPHRKSEAWRFADIGRLKFDGYRAHVPVRSELRAELVRASGESRAHRRPQVAGRLVFANDELLGASTLSPELAAQGVLFLPLAEALLKHGDLVKHYFMSQPTTLGGQKYEALHRAHCRAGAFLYVPKGVEVAHPFEAFYWIADGAAASFPHNLVIAEDNAKVELSVRYGSAPGVAGGLVCAVNDLHVKAGAKVRYITVQNLDDTALSLQIGATAVDRDGHALSLGVNLGCHYARTENKSRMLGRGSRSDMLSLTASHGDQEFDQRTYQEHVAPDTVSDLLYKNALADESTTIFAGMIAVDPGAQQTNAYQSNRNLLLSATAQANSLPGLEIEANDVRCTHGATSGQVREEEMFYMAQRGIPRPVAKRLFVLGFFDEVLGRLDDDALAAELHDLLEEKFARGKTL